MSNTIGFKNFRKFTNFPEIEIGDITILVGENNAGKSTLVKAMLLMRDFLKTRIDSSKYSSNTSKPFKPDFSFDAEHVNIGEFYRAFCRQSPSKENTISFSMKIGRFYFIVNVKGERKSGVIPEVSLVAVSDEEKDVTFTFDFTKGQMTARFGYDKKALNSEFDGFRISSRIDELHKLKRQLGKSTDLSELSNLKLQIERLEKEITLQNQLLDINITEEDSLTVDILKLKGFHTGELVITELIKSLLFYSESGTIGDKRSKEYKEQMSSKSFLEGKSTLIKELVEELEQTINSQTIEYIYAHSVYQDSVYSQCANSSDYTKRTIHEFYTSRISKGDKEFSMIEKWLQKFKIGTSLKVVPYRGDNYSLVVFDKENPEITEEKREGYPGGIDLADRGMGSIQLVILLLRLATLIRKYKGQQLTILLEEPEQNLHPAVQSQLADLVNNINKYFGVRFIIETHSEYLVRHTQVLAAKLFKEGIHDIPFKVFYITGKNNNPCDDMGFQTNGKFNKSFGPGFFNVADDAAMELFDLDEEN